MCSIFWNWILYLTNFYSLLPEKVNRFIFLPIWFFLCVLGFIVFAREWKNNRIFSISIGFLSSISFLFGLLLLVLWECKNRRKKSPTSTFLPSIFTFRFYCHSFTRCVINLRCRLINKHHKRNKADNKKNKQR